MDELRTQARQVAARLDVPDPPMAGEDLRILGARCLRECSNAGFMQFGFLAPDGPKSGDLGRTASVAEGMAYESGTLASIYMVNAVFAAALVAMLGTDEQKQSWLPLLAKGKAQLAFALSEPEAGSDAAAIETSAVRDVDGFRLSGEKLYTTGALTADRLLVVARAADTDREFGVFLVTPEANGVQVEPLDKLAGDAQPSCRVRMDDVRLRHEDLVGGEAAISGTWEVLRTLGGLERLMVAASCVGTGDRIYDEARSFALKRRQFGTYIVDFQVIQHRLVDMDSAVRVMRLLVQEAVTALEDGRDATLEICTAKYVCAERLQWLAGAGMRILGGRAFLTDSVMARLYRGAPLALYAGGTIEIQKNQIAHVLGLTGKGS